MKFLRWFCREEFIEEIEGNLTEMFEREWQVSPARAKRNFIIRVLKHFRPGFTKSFYMKRRNSLPLFRHQLTIAMRNFSRHRSAFAINLAGLWSGLACVTLIGLWVNDELLVDAFHKNDARLFQVMERDTFESGVGVFEPTSGLLADALQSDLATVESAIAFSAEGTMTVSAGDINVTARSAAASKDFFKAFSFDIVEGDANTVLDDKHNVAISETLAQKLFGRPAGVLGKSIDYGHSMTFTVGGVFRDVPTASTLRFELVYPYELYVDMNEWVEDWGNTSPHTYVLLNEGVEPEHFNKRITHFVQTKDPEKTKTLFIRKFSDAYLYGGYVNGVQSGGRIDYVRLFAVIGAFVLVIACINFTNLSTARASRRIKEVGIKKVSGAGRSSLARQFLVESVLIAAAGLLLSIATVYVLLPWFNEVVGKQITLSFDLYDALPLMSLVVVTGILAGAYPAFYLSSFRPSVILRGAIPGARGEQWVRKGLVVFQFAVSVVMISSVLVVYKQIEFIQQKDRGYNTSNVIRFPLEGRTKKQVNTFLDEVRKLPGVEMASASSNQMIGRNSWIGGLEWNGEHHDVNIELIRVNYDLIELMHIKVKEGRIFDRKFASDTVGAIFNEAAVKMLGMKDPVGAIVNNHKVIGVVKDFHFESLHEPIHPAVFIFSTTGADQAMVRLKPGEEQQAIESIGNFYKSFNPGFVFDFSFLDERFQQQYASEQRVSALSRYFAATAIIISCLGLFGLAAFTVERRRKEIGIRKVLGSSTGGIVWLLTSSFAGAVGMAIVIALPVGYFISDQWLSGFVFHMQLRWWYFAVAGIAALAVAWLTVSLQTYRAAGVNPTECLRNE